MRSFLVLRSFTCAAACCVALAVLSASVIQAAEFKPFLTLKIAGPGTIANIVEKMGSVVNDNYQQMPIANVKAELSALKKLPGVNTNGVIGLALQINENNPLGMDIVLTLPISNLETFNIPGQEMYVTMLKAMMQKEGNRYMLSSPVGDFVAYQKAGYFVVATMDAADVAQSVDPKTMFAGLDKMTLGVTFDLENISLENIEVMMGSLSMLLAMQGMETDPDALLEQLSVSEFFDEFSSVTCGVTIDERTLTLAGSMQTVPKKGSQTAEKFQKMKNAKTMFGGFLHDTSKTVFSWSYMDYLTDNEIAEATMALQLLGDSFAEGFRETSEEDEGDHGELFARLTEIIVEWLHENIESLGTEKSVDVALSLDSDGILLYAQAAKKPELAIKIGNDLYSALPELLGDETGKAVQAIINSKMKQNYETVEGFSLSGLSNMFTELPPGTVVPRAFRDLPLSLLWATKKDEAVAVAVGFDFARTERALKAALEKTKTPTQPKQTGVFALKPFGELMLKQVLPFAERQGGELAEAKGTFTIMASAENSAKIVVTTEFPGDTRLQKVQIDGKCFTTLLKVGKLTELTAAQAARE